MNVPVGPASAQTTASASPSHAAGLLILGVGIAVAMIVLVAVAVPRLRRPVMITVASLVASVVGLYLVVRGMVEFWVVRYGDPSSYRNDWGGPTLLGVFAVHTGPGLIVAVAAFWWWFTRRRNRRRSHRPSQ